ncbi:MAG TPA: hypothetical protein VGO96_14975 [Pyrinomonadaceae bacterium]|jgi:hypothetical protein|nr:hypothetical protein [Pyrinomonadaceae bacterium]
MRKLLMALSGGVVIVTLSVIVLAQGRGSVRAGQTERRTDGRTQGQIIERRPIYQPRFGVEVLAGGGAREKYPARGRIYVEAVEGEEYAVRLSNPLPVRVAVALSVDGLNTIDARRTTARDASKWVIPPYGSITVSGWQMSSTRARRFYFTNERDSYANRIGRATDLGVITAVFFRERRERTEIVPPSPSPRPLESDARDGERSSEAKRKAQGTAPSASADGGASNRGRVVAPGKDEEYAATGIGRSVGNDVWRVEMDLESQPVADVTLRYEFRDALVRLGVLPRTFPPHPDPLRRRERSRGFEDGSFSPEP